MIETTNFARFNEINGLYVFSDISLPVAPRLKLSRSNFEALLIPYRQGYDVFSRSIKRFEDKSLNVSGNSILDCLVTISLYVYMRGE